jgi:hypothetical protein
MSLAAGSKLGSPGRLLLSRGSVQFMWDMVKEFEGRE